MTYWALGCVQQCDLWVWRRNEKKDSSCVKLAICTDHRRRRRPLKFCMLGRVREIVMFQVSWKSVQGSPICGGSKIALSHWLGPWLIQQLVLPYKPWSVCSPRFMTNRKPREPMRIPTGKILQLNCTGLRIVKDEYIEVHSMYSRYSQKRYNVADFFSNLHLHIRYFLLPPLGGAIKHFTTTDICN